MDAPKNTSGKLKKLSLKNLRNNFGKNSRPTNAPEDVQVDELTDDGRSRALSIFRSLKKKCKGTLSNCKNKAHPLPERPRVPSVTAIEIDPPPPPVPPRVFTEDRLNGAYVNRGVQEELSTLARFGWYWGSISRAKVEEKLKDQPDGAFLVRDSSSDNYILSISFRSSGRTFHTRIEHSFGYYTFYSQQQGFSSIAELVETSMALSEGAVLCYSEHRGDDLHPGYPVRLTRPVSRFTEMRSLQYLCRFVIRQYITVNNITNLPLPSTVKGYIQEDYW